MLGKLYSAIRRRLGQWRVVSLLRKEYKAFLRSPKPYSDMRAQYLLRQGFVASKGRVLPWCHDLQRKQTPHQKAAASSVLFPNLDERAIESALVELRTNGFHVLPWRLPEDWVRRAVEAANKLDVVSRSDNADIQKPISLKPRAATYWHGPEVVSIPEFQSFVNDPAIREIIGRYLECVPVFDMATAWWSYPAGAASSASAQMYHFDLDRVRWLKVFVYLTDVGVDNGPHAFVRGSQKNVASKISHDGRYTDEEVFRMYSKADEVVFTGPAGTVFIEDTLGFHKGIPVRDGNRFVFEYEYSINCFGYPY